MDERIKERLTGAAILVVIVVLLVPEMFRGDRAASPSPVQAEPGAPPLRSYTIELDGMSAATAVASTPAEPPAPAPSAVAAAPTVTAPVATPPGRPPLPATTVKPASEKPAGDRAAGQWVVQVATFSQRDHAAHMVQVAAKKGVRLMVAGPDDRGLYRVRSAPQANRQAAAALQARLKSQGYSGMVSAAN